jgi:hypothetical protein
LLPRLDWDRDGGANLGGGVGGEKRLPAFVDDPIDGPVGAGCPEGGDGREGMEDVSHGTDADDEDSGHPE